ncbi:MAG: class II fructose-bisphosphate aldolase [Patescibacteria group bacterium]
MPSSLRSVFDAARRDGWAVGAFNVSNIEELHAVLRAAQTLEAPVLVEASPGESDHFGVRTLRAAVDEYRSRYKVQAWLNLDHATDQGKVREAIESGFDAVHYDGSKLSVEENIASLKELVPLAHAKGILVEGEPDHITGISTANSVALKTLQLPVDYSQPDAFKAFVEATKIDTAAAFVGNVHGLYDTPKRLDLPLLKQLRESVDCFLSLHGGSGIPNEDIKQAVALGVSKVNVNSELREAYLDGLRIATKEPTELAPYKYLIHAIEAVQAVVEQKIKLFGSAGRAKSTWIKRAIV